MKNQEILDFLVNLSIPSAVLMFALHVVQGMEESSLNRIGQYCLDNLINRLYET